MEIFEKASDGNFEPGDYGDFVIHYFEWWNDAVVEVVYHDKSEQAMYRVVWEDFVDEPLILKNKLNRGDFIAYFLDRDQIAAYINGGEEFENLTGFKEGDKRWHDPASQEFA